MIILKLQRARIASCLAMGIALLPAGEAEAQLLYSAAISLRGQYHSNVFADYNRHRATVGLTVTWPPPPDQEEGGLLTGAAL